MRGYSGVVDASRRLEISCARLCAYFARPTIAIAKIRDYSQSSGVVVSKLDFRLEGWWLKAWSLTLNCFLRQETLLYIDSLHPVVVHKMDSGNILLDPVLD